jgi:hypothetical protein
VAEYRLLTIWRIEAPLEEVYTAIHDSPFWPDWWPGVKKVEQVAAGDADGIDSVLRYSWQGKLPYRMVFDVRATRIEPLVAIEGTVHGDLEGVGRWHFFRQGAVSIVRYEWYVRSTRWWMNLIAPFARSMFIHNHGLLMQQGAEGLARRLGSRLAGQENIDLMASIVPPTKGGEGSRACGSTNLAMVLFAGLGAGVIATVAQSAMWWLAGIPIPETIFRDARLTAALVMGADVLPPPATPQWEILLVATVIHFTLSIAYALIAAHLAGRLRTGPNLLAGGLYGLAIYLINLHGFTLLFPWFAVARDWVTLIAHLVFGVALVGGCRVFTSIFSGRARGPSESVG